MSEENESSESFSPSPYAFRAQETYIQECSDAAFKAPPEWLLLDHTVAVVWLMYASSSDKPLGINQLQWVLEFLKQIKKTDGEVPLDVRACMSDIEDRLLDLYAQLTPAIVDEESVAVKKEKSVESLSEAPKVRKDIEAKKSGQELKVKDTKKPVCNNPISVSYRDTMNQNRKSKATSDSFRGRPASSGTTLRGDQEETVGQAVRATRKVQAADGSQVLKGDLINFLNQWRKEQVGRLESELERLKSLEEFMKIVDNDFVPFLGTAQDKTN